MSASKHILVVEDERHLAVGIKFNLEAEGFQVTTVGDGPSALRVIDEGENDFDLIVLDLMLPGMSGYAVCETIRSSGNDVPILILSARTLTEDRTRGFNVGASQYLTKPFDLDELLSRVKNLLTHFPRRRFTERVMPTKITSFEFSNAKIDFPRFHLQIDGKEVQLTKREWELLHYFVEHEGRLIPRQELLQNVWQMPGHIQTRAVDQFILRLRKIFEKEDAPPRHFLTVRDMGYRFVKQPDESATEGEGENGIEAERT
ncbi:Sensory transduction protein regX3 [Anatilimnocola aggregata]|uniref:Sensory transduction protein regX3 n=1 Tax=Anatilimnocola aggregata TaxID=2528021 RepID=A0A517YNN9_9BACT|nr:response regulator transcription factor [Anatilimnocola aggregata]QDU31844.1 Sensory transduction protein regX3 [Anatilimnocola aggregata]